MKDPISLYKYLHPGKILEQEITERNITPPELAAGIGEHLQTLNAVIMGRKKLTLELAEKLDIAFGFRPGTLYVLQAYYESDWYRNQKLALSPLEGPKVRRIVFWDCDFDKIDWLGSKEFVLERVHSYGNAEEKQEVLKYYGLDHYDHVPPVRYSPRDYSKMIRESDRGETVQVQFASDLHVEFPDNYNYLKDHPIIPTAEILVLAGDTIHQMGHASYLSHPFWNWASENFREVIVVPGNHEFYGGLDLGELSNGAQVEIRKNIYWYYNSVVTLDGIEFILTPLWSNIPKDAEEDVGARLADFRYTAYGRKPLDVSAYNNLNAECLSFLEKALSTPKRIPRIVVSHHAPSFRCVPEQFKGSILNSTFYNDLDNLIEKSDVDYWIYGHSHRNIGKVIMGNTALVSNQFGYVRFREHESFNPAAIIAL